MILTQRMKKSTQINGTLPFPCGERSVPSWLVFGDAFYFVQFDTVLPMPCAPCLIALRICLLCGIIMKPAPTAMPSAPPAIMPAKVPAFIVFPSSMFFAVCPQQ